MKGRSLSSLFLDQTEARRAEKNIFETVPPPSHPPSQGLDDQTTCPSTLPEGLDPLLSSLRFINATGARSYQSIRGW